MQQVEKVHVIFKTHLDIGFTDLAANVVNCYVDKFIPEAIKLADEMRKSSKDRFIWTTGSWLIYHALAHSNPENKKNLVEAVLRGDIRWHGYPFTTHTELMDPALLDYALSISLKLDKEFSQQTIAAKMTDVPGHTKALVTHFANSGLHYLHIGSNRSMKGPALPEFFRWKGMDGSELIVHYSHGYGYDSSPLKGFPEVIVFAHTGDNCGPPSVDEIEKEFEEIRKKYPNAKVEASTLDNFAKGLEQHRLQLPIIEEEIGDNWIYGTASDPKKIAHLRELLSLRNKWLSNNAFDINSDEYQAFHEQLLLITEHTWGLDEKLYLPDFHSYGKADFVKSRKDDVLNESKNPLMYQHISKNSARHFQYLFGKNAEKIMSERSFKYFESSWQEQRDYIKNAISALSDDKKEEAKKAISLLTPEISIPFESINLSWGKTYELGLFSVIFGEDGSIIHLLDSNNKTWASKKHRIGVYSYETFGENDYQNWFAQYTTNWQEHRAWAEPDLGKPGIEMMNPRAAHNEFFPYLVSIHHQKKNEADIVLARLKMPLEAYKEYGAPKDLAIKYVFWKDRAEIDISLVWQNKDAYRPPEASWFSISPIAGNPNRWLMDKLGEPVSPLQVLKDGNRYMHALNSGLSYESSDGSMKIECLDSPIVCPGEKRALCFDNKFAPLEGGWHFNLHNNLYGTNFRMWYEDDALFRYRLKFKSIILVK